ncbi:MAG: hypothetical protein JNL54_04270 [Kineosporiaceae bacterium]|nr:hypothetical protein [Kineosporiaceae bacterium]
MVEIGVVVTWLRSRLLDSRRNAHDEGASIVETVVIIAAFVAAAIVIVAILVSKATEAANNVTVQ